MAQRILRYTGYTDKAGQKIYDTDTVEVDHQPGIVTQFNGVWYVVYGEANHDSLEAVATDPLVDVVVITPGER